MDAKKHAAAPYEAPKKPYEEPRLTVLTRKQAIRMLTKSAANGDQDAARALEHLLRSREGKKTWPF